MLPDRAESNWPFPDACSCLSSTTVTLYGICFVWAATGVPVTTTSFSAERGMESTGLVLCPQAQMAQEQKREERIVLNFITAKIQKSITNGAMMRKIITKRL
jgi:hypothetical protein